VLAMTFSGLERSSIVGIFDEKEKGRYICECL